MNKAKFKKKFLDASMQEVGLKNTGLSHIEDVVHGVVKMLDTALLGYVLNKTTLKIYTSYAFKEKLDEMVKGTCILDDFTGQYVNIISESPFLHDGKMCILAECADGSRKIYCCLDFM
jgi:hypothetical protein